MSFYNEFDPFAAEWLQGLIDAGEIPAGPIDTRNICDVTADDVRGFTQCHFFAGIGGWPAALALAGWSVDRPVWTASCPCQPFSAAGKRQGQADERHLWPECFRLISECRPECVLGEQVPGAVGFGWLDGVFADLEGAGYTCGAVVLGAHSVGAPHKRQRLFWVAYAKHAQQRRPSVERSSGDETAERIEEAAELGGRGSVVGMVNANSHGRAPRRTSTTALGYRSSVDAAGGVDRLEHAASDGRDPRRAEPDGRSFAGGCDAGGPAADLLDEPGGGSVFAQWSDYRIIPCRDGKYRRISAQPGDEPLAYGFPLGVGRGQPELARLVRSASRNRKGRLKGYGNAIVPQVAAVFIRVVMEVMADG